MGQAEQAPRQAQPPVNLSDVEGAAGIYVMKGEFYPRPHAVSAIIKPTLRSVDLKAGIVKGYAASLLGLKKSVGKGLSVAGISRGLSHLAKLVNK